jgi:imidazoleglycerol phosphate dehydratase HisB
MDLTIKCDGDTQIDDHHSVEDIRVDINDLPILGETYMTFANIG